MLITNEDIFFRVVLKENNIKQKLLKEGYNTDNKFYYEKHFH